LAKEKHASVPRDNRIQAHADQAASVGARWAHEGPCPR